MSQQKKEIEYILGELIPRFEERLQEWNKEYTQERDLGIKGEFVGLYRKVRKLKTVIWDGGDDSEWREDTRTILLEVIGHAFLALYDYDHMGGEPTQKNPSPFGTPDAATNIQLGIPPTVSKKEALDKLKELGGYAPE